MDMPQLHRRPPEPQPAPPDPAHVASSLGLKCFNQYCVASQQRTFRSQEMYGAEKRKDLTLTTNVGIFIRARVREPLHEPPRRVRVRRQVL